MCELRCRLVAKWICRVSSIHHVAAYRVLSVSEPLCQTEFMPPQLTYSPMSADSFAWKYVHNGDTKCVRTTGRDASMWVIYIQQCGEVWHLVIISIFLLFILTPININCVLLPHRGSRRFWKKLVSLFVVVGIFTALAGPLSPQPRVWKD